MLKNCFIVLSQPRTGSSDLIQRLDGYEGINCFGEIFHHKNDHLDCEKYPELNEPKFSLEQREKDPLNFFNNLNAVYPDKLIGFKFFPKQNQKVEALVNNNSQIKIICLVRKNKLAQFASKKTADLSKQWHLSKDAERSIPEKPTFEPKLFNFFLNKHQKTMSIAGKSQKRNGNVHFIYYETLNMPKTYEGIHQFLGYEGNDKHVFFESIYKKMSSGPVAERFNNPELVEEYLKSNGLAHWQND